MKNYVGPKTIFVWQKFVITQQISIYTLKCEQLMYKLASVRQRRCFYILRYGIQLQYLELIWLLKPYRLLCYPILLAGKHGMFCLTFRQHLSTQRIYKRASILHIKSAFLNI